MNDMKTFLLGVLLVIFLSQGYSQNEKREFETIVNIETTPVKHQALTGTCWDFATISFVETELIRMNKGSYDLSEMFYVRNIYPQKARKYVFYQGKFNFGQGGQAHDVMNGIRDFGIVPESVYNGMNIETETHNHSEMVAVINGMLDAVIRKRGGEITPRWMDAVEAVLDIYMGKIPEEFVFNGKHYTPKTFAETLNFNPDDYIELTSFGYYPFYKKCMLELPDNWSMDVIYQFAY